MRRLTVLCALPLALALVLASCGEGNDAERDSGGSATKGDDLDDSFPSVDPAEYDFRTDDFDRYDEVVDGQGIAFSDTILGRRANKFSEIGAKNTDIKTLTAILKNFADLAVAFGRDFERMGFDTCANLEGVDVERTSEKSLSLLTAYEIVLFARILWSWFRPPSHGFARSVFDLIYDLTEPVLRAVRGLIPALRVGGMGIDFSPILVFIALGVLGAVVGCGFRL